MFFSLIWTFVDKQDEKDYLCGASLSSGATLSALWAYTFRKGILSCIHITESFYTQYANKSHYSDVKMIQWLYEDYDMEIYNLISLN